MAESHRNAQPGGILRGLRLWGQREAGSPWRWVWVGACPGCSGAGGCLLLLERSSSPLTAPAIGEPLLQGDCKMNLAEAEAQRDKCSKLNHLCFVDCLFFLSQAIKQTPLWGLSRSWEFLLCLCFSPACPFPTCPAHCRIPQGSYSCCSSTAVKCIVAPWDPARWSRGLEGWHCQGSSG